MTDLVSYELRGATAILTLNRPEARNAVNKAVAEALRAALRRFEADEAARVGALAGAGGVFCAGMDLKAFLGGEGDEILFGENRFAGFVDAPREKPMIAAVEGAALAGGFELALACDMIVSADDAVFGLPEPGVGLFACGGGAFRLGARIAPAKALELLLTGDRISATEANRLGIVNRLAAPGEALGAACDLAARIAGNAPLGVAASLAVARAAAARGERELWALCERHWAQVAASQDAEEGPRAFAEKRRPAWRGV